MDQKSSEVKNELRVQTKRVEKLGGGIIMHNRYDVLGACSDSVSEALKRSVVKRAEGACYTLAYVRGVGIAGIAIGVIIGAVLMYNFIAGA